MWGGEFPSYPSPKTLIFERLSPTSIPIESSNKSHSPLCIYKSSACAFIAGVYLEDVSGRSFIVFFSKRWIILFVAGGVVRTNQIIGQLVRLAAEFHMLDKPDQMLDLNT